MKKSINEYLIKYLIILLITMLIEFGIWFISFLLKGNPINIKDLGIIFIGFNLFAIFVTIQIYISRFSFECSTYMFILGSVGLCYEYIKTLNIIFLHFFVFTSGLSIFFRIFLWKYYLEKVVYTDPLRKIQIDLSVINNSEEVFYKRIIFQAKNKCSDLLMYFKKNYLSEIEPTNKSYKFYIDNKLMYNISETGEVEYCQSFDFELGSFPVKKILCSKIEETEKNV